MNFSLWVLLIPERSFDVPLISTIIFTNFQNKGKIFGAHSIKEIFLRLYHLSSKHNSLIMEFYSLEGVNNQIAWNLSFRHEPLERDLQSEVELLDILQNFNPIVESDSIIWILDSSKSFACASFYANLVFHSHISLSFLWLNEFRKLRSP